jgi:hypothetical protein
LVEFLIILRFLYSCFKSIRLLQSELANFSQINSLSIPSLKVVKDISIESSDGLWNINPTISNGLNIYFRQTTGAFFPIAKLDGIPRMDNPTGNFGNGIFKAKVTPNLKLKSVYEILPLRSTPCLEDVRVIEDNGKEYLIGTLVTSSRPKPWKSSVAIYDVQSKRMVILKSPRNRENEKNWVPIEASEGSVKILYSSNPQITIEVDLQTGEQINSIPIPQKGADLNGGSQLLKLPDGRYLRIARKRFAVLNRGRIHLSYFVLHDRNLMEINRSRPFVFQTLGFEICNGLSFIDKHEIIIAWGENDRKMYLATASLEEIIKWIVQEKVGKSHYSLYRIFKLLH